MRIKWIGLGVSLLIFSCGEKSKDTEGQNQTEQTISAEILEVITQPPAEMETPEGMVWIPGGNFLQGASEADKLAMDHEKPQHRVAIDGFFMDETEVTNAQFTKFVQETGYNTVAERELDWEELKKQLPAGTPKPPDSIMQPGSLTFKKTKNKLPNLYDYSQWWDWTVGASWKHPKGPGTGIEGKDNYPVVHIAYEDAVAYCKWAGKRLPTEAEWEYAAKGGLTDALFSWGDDATKLSEKANTWEGEFPNENSEEDGFENKAPVKSYPANGYGLYDMAGNVWEFTQDWFDPRYYENFERSGTKKNPRGAGSPYNPNNPQVQEKVIKGGSFLCSASYCASYRPSARMSNSVDSSQEHLGFRTVMSAEMIKN